MTRHVHDNFVYDDEDDSWSRFENLGDAIDYASQTDMRIAESKEPPRLTTCATYSVPFGGNGPLMLVNEEPNRTRIRVNVTTVKPTTSGTVFYRIGKRQEIMSGGGYIMEGAETFYMTDELWVSAIEIDTTAGTIVPAVGNSSVACAVCEYRS